MIKTTFFLFCIFFRFDGFYGKLIFIFMIIIAPTSHNNYLNSGKNFNRDSTTNNGDYIKYEENSPAKSTSTYGFTKYQPYSALSTTAASLIARSHKVNADSSTTDSKSAETATLESANFLQNIFRGEDAFAGESTSTGYDYDYSTSTDTQNPSQMTTTPLPTSTTPSTTPSPASTTSSPASTTPSLTSTTPSPASTTPPLTSTTPSTIPSPASTTSLSTSTTPSPASTTSSTASTTPSLRSTTPPFTSTTPSPTPTPSTCETLPYKKDKVFCPNGLIFVEPYYCYKLIQNVNYYSECPYNNYLPFSNISQNIMANPELKETSIWIRSTRNITKSCFENFQWTEPGEYFGNITSVHITNCTFGCVTVRDGSLIGTSCYEKHSHLCVYHYYQSNFCNRLFPDHETCSFSHFDNKKSNCYCQVKAFPNQCQKLAEPKEPFQSQMLLTPYYFSKFEFCWFGLERQREDQFVWKSSREIVDYSYWLHKINCEYNNGALSFSEDPGWTLEKQSTSNCSMCEFSIPRANVELQLKHSGSVNKLYLFITNPLLITNTFADLNLYCFHNAKNFVERIEYYPTEEVHKMIISNIANYPSQYWCKAFQFPENKVVRSNTIITYDRSKEFGYEYAIYISIHTLEINYVRDGRHIDVCNSLLEQIQKESNNSALSLRPIKILETSQLDLLVHLTTVKTSRSQAEEHSLIFKILRDSTIEGELSIPEFLSSEVCFSTTSLSLDNKELVWPETRIGTTVVPSNLLCLDKSNKMKPVIRKCVGDFMEGARWLEPEGNCLSDDSGYTKTTRQLFALTNKTEINDADVTELLHITESSDEQISADVYFISSIIKKVPEDGNKMDVYKIINNMMNYDTSVLRDAQDMLNATDDILYKLDTLLSSETQTNVTLSNIIFRIANLNEVIGMTLHKRNGAANSFESYDLISWGSGTSLESVTSKNLEAAVLFSNYTIGEINEAVNSNVPLKLIVLMFYTNALFNEPGSNGTEKLVKNKIVTILIPGFSGYLNHPINVIYTMLNDTDKMCSFWKYGWDDSMVSIQGKWDEESDDPVNYKNFDVCNFFHMTHFGLLLGGQYNNPKAVFFLKLLTAVGLASSLVGIVPIFITFAMFKVWRARSSNILLINFCFVITLETIVMFIMDSVNEDGVVCKLMGALLHYLVLSEFFWMLTIGLLQYRRFVHVLKPPYKDVVIKSCIIGWVSPVFPIFIIVCISTDNYGINESQFCYAIGVYTILFGLYLPIVIVLIINIFIFISIFISMSKTTVKAELNNKIKSYKLKLYLALLLFFVLGMTWLFGLLGIFTHEITFIYLFCATATIRGFILFLYFILMNKECMLMWKRRIQQCKIYLQNKFYQYRTKSPRIPTKNIY